VVRELAQLVPVYAYEFDYQKAPYHFPQMPGDFRQILILRHRCPGRREVLIDANGEVAFVVNVAGHDRHLIEVAGLPGVVRLQRNYRAVYRHLSEIGSGGVRCALKLENPSSRKIA
jgi:hypothetical protein